MTPLRPPLSSAALGNLPTPAVIASVATIPSVSLSLLTGPLGAASESSLPTLTAMASLAEGPRLSSGSVPAGLKLSSTFPPLPAKLVAKAQAGLYVEMKELLTDNISLQHQLDALHSQPAVQLLAAVRPRMREVGSPLVWVYCFLAYAAIRAPDQGTRDHLTYARLLLREAMHHGGMGWKEYNRDFRQQVALDPSGAWSELNASLFVATILSGGTGPGTSCSLCHEADHQAQDCALVFFQTPPPAAASAPRAGPLARYQPSARVQMGQGTLRRAPRPETLERICVSWNRGICMFPGTCSFRHVCATCRERGHKAQDCLRMTRHTRMGQDIKPEGRQAQQKDLPLPCGVKQTSNRQRTRDGKQGNRPPHVDPGSSVCAYSLGKYQCYT